MLQFKNYKNNVIFYSDLTFENNKNKYQQMRNFVFVKILLTLIRITLNIIIPL